ncbi:MAG: hypothetical protein AAF479_14095 [Pseudomonadota bacterium]
MPDIGKALAVALIVALVSGPVSAEPKIELHISENLKEALREMLDQMRPALNEALDMMQSFDAIDDPRNYQLPEVLPNGDIIIRRRPDAPDLPHDRSPPEIQEEPDGSIRT